MTGRSHCSVATPGSPNTGKPALRKHAAPSLTALLFGLTVWAAAQSSVQAQQPAGQAPPPAASDPTEAPVTEKSKKVPRFTPEDRARYYQQTTFSPFAFSGPLAGAAVIEWTTHNPPEWDQGFAGFGRRVASGYGRQVIANTIGLGVAFAANEDPRHYPTGQHGVWKRGLYAAREAFVSRSATTGALMPAYSRIAGAYAAGFISNAWYPPPYSNVHSALYRGSTALVSDIVWQEFKEFWPDVRRKLRNRH